jgi:hypothetical protein
MRPVTVPSKSRHAIAAPIRSLRPISRVPSSKSHAFDRPCLPEVSELCTSVARPRREDAGPLAVFPGRAV